MYATNYLKATDIAMLLASLTLLMTANRLPVA